MHDTHRYSAARRGFTLLELLVALVILAVLATLVVVYLIPAFQDNKNVVRTADRVTTALLIAKQRALRDQAPRGVRFIQDPTVPLPPLITQNANLNGLIFQQMQYIELPDPIAGQPLGLPAGSPPGGQVDASLTQNATTKSVTSLSFQNVDFFGGADTGNYSEFVVQPGDYFRTGGANYLIGDVPSSTSLLLAGPTQKYPQQRQLAVAIPQPAGTKWSGQWQIIRQTRPIPGESVVNLPQNVALDMSIVQTLTKNNIVSPGTQLPMRTVTNPSTGASVGFFEILFGAGGNVVNFQKGSSPAIVIVVRDISVTDPATASFPIQGVDPNYARVLGVNPRTGMIAGQSVAPGNNPVAYALDGKASGL
jgi:prepilin-type N-terminal cleavage/methylation domain-containing protein